MCRRDKSLHYCTNINVYNLMITNRNYYIINHFLENILNQRYQLYRLLSSSPVGSACQVSLRLSSLS